MRNSSDRNDAVIESELLRRYRLFQCLLFRRRRPRCGSSQRRILASQIC